MNWVTRHAGVREAVWRDLFAVQQEAEEIAALLDDSDLVLAVDVAAITEAQGATPHAPARTCPIEELSDWDSEIVAAQTRLQVARERIARLKSESVRLREELAWELP